MVGPFALYSRGLDRSHFIDGGYKNVSSDVKWRNNAKAFIFCGRTQLQEGNLQVSLVTRNFLCDLQLGPTAISINVLPCTL